METINGIDVSELPGVMETDIPLLQGKEHPPLIWTQDQHCARRWMIRDYQPDLPNLVHCMEYDEPNKILPTQVFHRGHLRWGRPSHVRKFLTHGIPSGGRVSSVQQLEGALSGTVFYGYREVRKRWELFVLDRYSAVMNEYRFQSFDDPELGIWVMREAIENEDHAHLFFWDANTVEPPAPQPIQTRFKAWRRLKKPIHGATTTRR